ncbi:armadillo-type protein [Mycena metata]|uniref:Armadillo-type protein n=1 Tax=Mycena metata TaxID=1033252 RepID=A0AAD7H5K0_9AGAR|nr:armadillo-type protein [Mycena metata]
MAALMLGPLSRRYAACLTALTLPGLLRRRRQPEDPRKTPCPLRVLGHFCPVFRPVVTPSPPNFSGRTAVTDKPSYFDTTTAPDDDAADYGVGTPVATRPNAPHVPRRLVQRVDSLSEINASRHVPLQHAEALLDFSRPFDVSLMDRVAMTFYTGAGQEQQMAQLVLTQFEEHPESWTRVPEILEKSTFPQAKFIGLQILERLVTTRWKTLPESQRQGIRNFIVGETVKVASDDVSLRRERTYLNKLNLVLVQVLKQEWPHNWPTFISELVQSSTVNLSLCENNMAILKLLSEEIFDFSAEQMTQTKTKNLKNQISGEFSEIFKLCCEVLKDANKSSICSSIAYVAASFPPPFYPHIDAPQFLEQVEFHNVTLKCLAEIAVLEVGPEYDQKFVNLFAMVMAAVNRMIPPNTDIAKGYAESDDDVQELILNLTLFLTNFLSSHLRALESDSGPSRDALLNAHLYLVKISQVEEREVFKICLEYWGKLVAELYDEVRASPVGESGLLMGLNLGGGSGSLTGIPLRKDIYANILSNLRLVMIGRMVKQERLAQLAPDQQRGMEPKKLKKLVLQLERELDRLQRAGAWTSSNNYATLSSDATPIPPTPNAWLPSKPPTLSCSRAEESADLGEKREDEKEDLADLVERLRLVNEELQQ